MPISISKLITSSESQWTDVSKDILSKRKSYHIFSNEPNTFLLAMQWQIPSNTPVSGSTQLITPNGRSIASYTSTQLHNKVPIGYNGMPHIHPKITLIVGRWPSPFTCLILGPSRPTSPPDPISHFSTVHWTGRPMDRQMGHAVKITCTNTLLCSIMMPWLIMYYTKVMKKYSVTLKL